LKIDGGKQTINRKRTPGPIFTLWPEIFAVEKLAVLNSLVQTNQHDAFPALIAASGL
jgi:hypothetical protein